MADSWNVSQTAAPPTPTWRQRITGRWALSWQAYVVGVGLNVPILVFTGGSIGTQPIATGDMPILLLLGLGAAAAVGVWLVVADLSWMRNRREHPVSLLKFGIFHLAPGIFFGLAVVWGDALRDESSIVPPWARILITMGIGLWFGTAMALVLEARDRYRRERSALLAEAIKAETAALRESEAAVRIRAVVNEQLDVQLQDARADLTTRVAELAHRDSTDPSAAWLGLSMSLRDTAQGTVRTVSRAMWESVAEAHPLPRVDSVVREFLRHPRFLILPSAFIVIIGFLTSSMVTFGVGGGILAVLALATAVGVAMWGAQSVAARHPSAQRATYAASFALALAMGAAFSVIAGATRSTDTFIFATTVIGAFLGMGVSVVLPSVVASLNAVRATSLADLRDDVAQARIAERAWRDELAEVTREIAAGLHGTVQTRLIACAAAIDQAIAQSDRQLRDDAVRESLMILRQVDRPVPEQEGLSLGVTRVSSLWAEFMEISVEMDEELSGRTDLASVVLVVEEALANAYRHGRANGVSITVTIEGDEVRLLVKDDGEGFGEYEPGMGCVLYERWCGDRYTLENGPEGGTVLSAMLTVERR